MSPYVICQRNKKSCQKNAAKRKLSTQKNNPTTTITCICRFHLQNEMIYQRCLPSEDKQHEKICLCSSRYNGNGYIQCYLGEGEGEGEGEEHDCVCPLKKDGILICKARNHKCICGQSCSWRRVYSCLAKKENHLCICLSMAQYYPSSAYHFHDDFASCYALQHPCICKYTTPEKCKNENEDHDCICSKYSCPGRCKRNSQMDHDCICDYALSANYNPLKTRYLMLQYHSICISHAHKQICICSLGIEQMKVCPSTNEHFCMCCSSSGNSIDRKKLCRQHKTFHIWNEWESFDSYLYWIPEEVLEEIIIILFCSGPRDKDFS
jgi:hypothetical protein